MLLNSVVYLTKHWINRECISLRFYSGEFWSSTRFGNRTRQKHHEHRHANVELSTDGQINRLCEKAHDGSQPKVESTVDEEEIKRFSSLANLWWKESGEFDALHTLNVLRIPLIRDALLEQSGLSLAKAPLCQPLKGLALLDVGCGGGVLSEPLARLGASVIGVDATEKNVKVAQSHAELDPRVHTNVKYIHASVEDLVGTEEETFDGVIASEIIEHVFNVPDFISSCCKLVKPGGSVFFTTISKTYLSYILAVVAAEDLLHLVPKGTHDWDKFITPEDLQNHLNDNKMTTRLVHGLFYNPLSRRWMWTSNTSVNYAIHAVKPKDDSFSSESSSDDSD